VDLPADQLFAFLPEPGNLPRYFPAMTDTNPPGRSRLESTIQARNSSGSDCTLYRLNCRPVHQVPAHGRVRFEMVTRIHSGVTGRRFAVTWKMHARNFNAGLWAETHFMVL
jgi:hypothetical protein